MAESSPAIAASPGSSRPSPARVCRTFQHVDKLKRKLSLIAPADTRSHRSSPERCGLSAGGSIGACAVAGRSVDEFAFEEPHAGDDDEADVFAFEPHAEPVRDEFAFVPSDSEDDDDDERAVPVWPSRPPARDGQRAAAWPRAGASRSAHASPANSTLNSGAVSSPAAARGGRAESDDVAAGKSARPPPSTREPSAGASGCQSGCRSGPCTPSRAASSASPSPRRAHAPSALAKQPSPLSARQGAQRISPSARCTPPGARPAADGGGGGVAPAKTAAELAAERALPPATTQLLAVLSHCVSADVWHADEAEISSDESDASGAPQRPHDVGAGLAEGQRAASPPGRRAHTARVRTNKCALAEVAPHVRAALLRSPAAGGCCVLAAVELLLEQGADVDAVDADRNFPLYLACHLPAEPDALAVSRTLLRRRAHPNERRRGLTPLNYALRRGHAELARVLLQHGGYPLRWTDAPQAAPAVRRGGSANGANGGASGARGRLSSPLLRSFAQARGFWPLALSTMLRLLNEAVDEGAVPVVEGLLIHGCPPNEKDAHGRTPLFRAVAVQQRPQLVLALLRGGAHAETRDGFGTHVLAAPIIRNDAPTVRALLKYRADPLADEEGVRLDQFAAHYSTSSAVQLLLSRCAAHALALRAAPARAGAPAEARAGRQAGGGPQFAVSRAGAAALGASPVAARARGACAASMRQTPALPPPPGLEGEDQSVFEFDFE